MTSYNLEEKKTKWMTWVNIPGRTRALHREIPAQRKCRSSRFPRQKSSRNKQKDPKIKQK